MASMHRCRCQLSRIDEEILGDMMEQGLAHRQVAASLADLATKVVANRQTVSVVVTSALEAPTVRCSAGRTMVCVGRGARDALRHFVIDRRYVQYPGA